MSPDLSSPGQPGRSSVTGGAASYPGLPVEQREVQWAFSESLPSVLERLNCSVLITTYQTGHLVVLSAPQGQLMTSFHTFEKPMGMAIRPGWLVVGARTQVWSLRNFPNLAATCEPRGRHDACYLTRFSHFTGNIYCHELAWVSSPLAAATGEPIVAAGTRAAGERGVELWIVNTLFSCLCAVNSSYSFTPRWRPPFVSALAPEDRCHLNGVAVANGKARYVTALAETDSAQGWRPVKLGGGCVIDVLSNQTVVRGLTMPHSPRIVGEQLLVLHSGVGQLATIDLANGRLDTVTQLPGYVRGLAIHGNLAFVGMSKIRTTSSLGGMPIAAKPEQLRCGLAVVDLQTGQVVGDFDFVSGIDELFDVQVLPNVSFPIISGPYADRGPGQPIWTVPPH